MVIKLSACVYLCEETGLCEIACCIFFFSLHNELVLKIAITSLLSNHATKMLYNTIWFVNMNKLTRYFRDFHCRLRRGHGRRLWAWLGVGSERLVGLRNSFITLGCIGLHRHISWGDITKGEISLSGQVCETFQMICLPCFPLACAVVVTFFSPFASAPCLNKTSRSKHANLLLSLKLSHPQTVLNWC